jgi:hypothetical protein
MTTLAAAHQALARIATNGGALELAEAVADIWVERSRNLVPKDTKQTEFRTTLTAVRGSGVRGVAEVQSDTPYAGYIQYGSKHGTTYVAPRPYWSDGRDHAVKQAERYGRGIETELRRSLVSGGVWNPRAAFNL